MNPSSVITLAVSASVMGWMGWHWWPHWGLAFAAEDAPLAWWQAALLVANATAAGSLATVHAAIGSRRGTVSLWALLATGLIAAALDERFMAHEALQEWLTLAQGVPSGLAQSVILGYAVGGCVLFRLAMMQSSTATRGWTAGALLAGGVALALDLGFNNVAVQIGEELLEALAETLLLAGLFSELGSAVNRQR